MTTQIISHNADNQLFKTRKEALESIALNELKIAQEVTTLPCSFDERQRNRYDLNYDDEMAINAFVIESCDEDPMLIGYMQEGVKLYLVNTYEAYMASEQGVNVTTEEPNDTIDYKHEVLAEEEISLPEGVEYRDIARVWLVNDEPADLLCERVGEAYEISLISASGQFNLYTFKL